jgi:uncharacterized membrane protein YedE/YeeE
MAEKSRGATLTIFAILFGLLALSNFIKPFSHDPGTTFIFLGGRMSGAANFILAFLFGILLAAYAYGIWTMRKFALPIAYFYFPWVILNTIAFGIKNLGGPQPSLPVAIGSILVGIGVPLAALVMLRRRRAELA